MDTEDFDRDPAVTLQLRSLMRPPADPAYWDGLEARIMAQVLADEKPVARARRTSGAFAVIGGWWEPFAQWRRIGGMAAAAALLLTVWGLWKTSSDERRLADEAAVEALSIPLDSTGRPLSDAPREKTVPDLFRY
ncbi:MAG: hypothetical protein IT355_15500 [Gemmatimonadaceae bacterium]|nr:hypothetical protein [Gemmatimonadaceae bacterium]